MKRQNRQTPIAAGFAAWCQFTEHIGRTLMMDFGLAGFLDKLEKYYGTTVTKCVTFLMGLALAVFCLHLTFVFGVKPVYDAVYSLYAS